MAPAPETDAVLRQLTFLVGRNPAAFAHALMLAAVSGACSTFFEKFVSRRATTQPEPRRLSRLERGMVVKTVGGEAKAEHLIRLLAGFNVHALPISGDKIVRFSPFSAQAEAGNVLVMRGAWNDDWFTALENFPPASNAGHYDDADSTSEAFNVLAGDNLAT